MTGWGGKALGLEQRLLARFRSASIPTGIPLIVAFSGGPDSLALAAGLAHVRAVTGLPLLLVHVDHRLRDSSRDDAEAAVALGRQFGDETVVRHVPIDLNATHPETGIEDAARRERYRILGEEARHSGARFIATGHHREDQAETVLLHLLRGSGLHGAAGMAELADLPFSDQGDISQKAATLQLRLWRPFLREPRSEILAYLKERQLTPTLDPSNDDQAFRRNALRHRVLPAMETAFPGAAAALARYALLAAEEDSLVERMVDDTIPTLLGPGGALRYTALKYEPLALQRRLLRRWLVETTGDRDIGFERVEAVLDWASSARSAGKVQLNGSWSVRRSGEWLIVDRGERSQTGEGQKRDKPGAARDGSGAHPDR